MKYIVFPLLLSIALFSCTPKNKIVQDNHSHTVDSIVSQLSLHEKIGQMAQYNYESDKKEQYIELIKQGKIGSFLNITSPELMDELQKVAIESSPGGIPIIFARDVIHGFKTIFPIPLAQACSWNPDLIEKASSIAAKEATSKGIRWTFAPMMDIARDPRWGRIAESCGEDPYLCSIITSAMIRGFQGDSLCNETSLAACAKHYIAYGAAEGGRDYNTTNLSESSLRNTYLPPFTLAVKNNVATIMSAFNEINGIPASGNKHTLKEILRDELGFDGVVVSDWNSMTEMIAHGYCKDEKQVALKAIEAGVDMEMVSQSYDTYLAKLIDEGAISEDNVNKAVKHIISLKVKMGLFNHPYVRKSEQNEILSDSNKVIARKLASESMVLLKNNNKTLPIMASNKKIAIIGPLADAANDQNGCWAFDGEGKDGITPLQAFKTRYRENILFSPGLEHSRSVDTSLFADAISIARKSDIILLFLGEEAILSGEGHSRAFIDLPGAQYKLFHTLKKLHKPIVAIILAGRPLTITTLTNEADAIIYAWHPGTMTGPAIEDIVSGKINPQGRLAITFPRTVGQIPMYYNHKMTGRPPTDTNRVEIPIGTPLDPSGLNSKYVDVRASPLYPFGYGLSYSEFEYSNISVTEEAYKIIRVTCTVTNRSSVAGTETCQLYCKDHVGSLTRPVKELKAFKKVHLQAGESQTISFDLYRKRDLIYYTADNVYRFEEGEFTFFTGSNSRDCISSETVYISQ